MIIFYNIVRGVCMFVFALILIAILVTVVL
jgi:hypothetical protein